MDALRERILRALRGLLVLAVIGAFTINVLVVVAMIGSSVWTGYALPSIVIIGFSAAVWVPVTLYVRKRRSTSRTAQEDEEHESKKDLGPIRISR